MNAAPVVQPTRFVGIDLHKDYVMIGAVDGQQNIVLTPRRCRLFEVEQWRAKYLLAADAVVRELRGLVAHRRRLVNLRTQARNRLHAILHRHALPLPDGGLFAQKQRVWWESLPLSASERLQALQDQRCWTISHLKSRRSRASCCA